MEKLGDDELGIIWTNAATNLLYFSKRTGETTFSTPLQLNPVGTEVQDYNWSGPDLCASGSDVYVTYRDLGYETGHVYLVKSQDYGVTFGDTVRVDNLVTEYAQFPDVAVYNDTVYVTYMTHGFVTMNPQMALSRSVDGGQTFQPMVEASAWIGEEVCDCCPPEIIVDEERVIIIYRQNVFNEREIRAVVSYDRGETFSQVFVPDNHDWIINACPSSGADGRFLENGNPVCAYRTNFESEPSLYVNEYDLDADVAVNTVEIYASAWSNAGINYPQIAVAGPTIGLVWEGLGVSTDVFFNASYTGVANLLPENAINVTEIANSQSKPDLAILDGKFHIIYSELSGAVVKYVQVQNVTSVEEHEVSAVSLFPNPVSNAAQLDLSAYVFSTAEVTIYDLSGKVVYASQIASGSLSVNLNLEHLAPGTYNLQLVIDKKIEQLSFVKN